MYDRPMIYWPIQTLVNSGIGDILIVCGGNAAGEFLQILGNGEQFGLKRLNYAYQSEPRGIADALIMAKDFAGDETMAVILADNIFENPVKKHVDEFDKTHKLRRNIGWKGTGLCGTHATIFTTSVKNPSSYGVVETDGEKVISIEEKPKKPKTDQISVGLYMYTPLVWDYIFDLKPSKRGELEITDLNNFFLEDGRLEARKITGRWADAGESIDGYLDCCNMAFEFAKSNKDWKLGK